MAYLPNKRLLWMLATAVGTTAAILILAYLTTIFAVFVLVFASLLAVGILTREKGITKRKHLIEDAIIAFVVTIPLYYLGIIFVVFNIWSTLIFFGILTMVLFVYEVIKSMVR